MHLNYCIFKSNLSTRLVNQLSRSGLNAAPNRRNVHGFYYNVKPRRLNGLAAPEVTPSSTTPQVGLKTIRSNFYVSGNDTLNSNRGSPVCWYSTRRISRRSSRADPILNTPEARQLLTHKQSKEDERPVTDQEAMMLFNHLMGLTNEEGLDHESPPSKISSKHKTQPDSAKETSSRSQEKATKDEVYDPGTLAESILKNLAITDTHSVRAAENAKRQFFNKLGNSELIKLQQKAIGAESNEAGSSQTLTIDSFNRVINVNAKLGRIDEAEQAMALLKEAGISPNLKTYNLMINAYGVAGKLGKAVDAFKSIEKSMYTNFHFKLPN